MWFRRSWVRFPSFAPRLRSLIIVVKKLRLFFRDYRQFGFVVVSVIIACVLTLLGQAKWANLVLALSAIANVIPLLWDMWQDLRAGKYGVDILAATAIITSVILQEYWAGIIIVVMLTGGEALEDYAEKRAKTELSALLAHKPKKAHLLKGKKVVEVKAADVKSGDKIVIYPGEVIPIDSIILEGTTSVDEASLTGESLPIEKNPGDQVLSGSVNIDGALTVKTTASAEDSQYQQIIRLVKSAAASQAPFVRLADKYAVPFTVVAYVIAGAAWFISGDSLRFLQVIIVATPCPLILAAPIALISGMSRSARSGIIVKTGAALEQLAQIETLAFDKTGTLTRGIPKVDKVKTVGERSTDEVLAYAAALEMSSQHILAKAIVDAAQQQKLSIPKAKKVHEFAGKGLSGAFKGSQVLVGRHSLMEDNHIPIPEKFAKSQLTHTASYVAIDGQLVGVISFVDEVRPNAKDMLDALRASKVQHTLMVTGDNTATAQRVARELDIEEVVADCLPADKIQAIEAIKRRPVGFVGDGVNDAPVLAVADVGIALGARGSTAASESADVVIMQDNIMKVSESVAIAKRTFGIATQSILIGIFISIGLMAIFATGKFAPIWGAALQEVVDVIVIFNALRAHSSKF